MAIGLGIIGMFGFLACLVWLIVCAVRLDSKKPPLIGMLVCAVLFFVGMGLYSPESSTAPPDNSDDLETDVEDTTREMPSGEESGQEPPEESEELDDGPLKTGDYELPNGVKLHFYDSVRNDMTGLWRRSGTSSSMPPADFAIEYYETMFSSEDEIHSVWNATLNTTTRISASGNLLFVDTYEYVKKEEQDAKIMFSGKLLDSQIIDLTTGRLFEEPESNVSASEPTIESEEKPEDSAPAAASSVQASTAKPSGNTSKQTSTPNTEQIVTPEPAPSKPANSSGSGSGNGDNFNTYDNEDQQKTSDSFVLNTSTMKIHYPTCREVKKIAPQNYIVGTLENKQEMN